MIGGLIEVNRRIRQRQLLWFGHVRREAEESVLKMVDGMEVLGKRPSGKTKNISINGSVTGGHGSLMGPFSIM